MWRGQGYSAVDGHRRSIGRSRCASLTLFTLLKPDETPLLSEYRRACRISIAHGGSDPETPIAVPDLTSTACIKLNARMLLLSIFERIACTTPDNCPVRLNVAKPPGQPQSV